MLEELGFGLGDFSLFSTIIFFFVFGIGIVFGFRIYQVLSLVAATVMVPVLIAPVNESFMGQDAVILNLTVQNALGDAQEHVDTTEFSGDNNIL